MAENFMSKLLNEHAERLEADHQKLKLVRAWAKEQRDFLQRLESSIGYGHDYLVSVSALEELEGILNPVGDK